MRIENDHTSEASVARSALVQSARSKTYEDINQPQNVRIVASR